MSLDPAHDRPENLKKFAETHNLVRPNWWFVTGDPDELNKYMLKVFALSAKPKPPEQRANEFDLFDHQAIVVLVDHELKMVGWYYPFESKSMEQLKKQLRATLATAEKAA